MLSPNAIYFPDLTLPFGRVEEEERRRGEGIWSRNVRNLTLPAGSYLAIDPPALRGWVKVDGIVLSLPGFLLFLNAQNAILNAFLKLRRTIMSSGRRKVG